MESQIAVRLPDEQAQKLRSLAKQKGVTLSALVRELVEVCELVPVQSTKWTVKASVQQCQAN